MITEEQRLARRNSIGGSDMPIILGLSNYKTPYQLYLEKKGLITEVQEETPVQYWGNQLEGVLRTEFSKRNNVSVIEPKDTIEHPLYPFLKGNLDGLIPEWKAVWEGKTSSAYMAQTWGEPGSDIIPLQYLVQLAFYCAVINYNKAHLSVLIGGNDYREFTYIRDMELENRIIDAACKFWSALQNDKPPPATKQIDLRIMFPKHHPDKCKIINPAVLEHLTYAIEMKAKIKELQEIEDSAKFNVMKYMEDSEILLSKDEKPMCTWKTNKKGQRTFLIKQFD